MGVDKSKIHRVAVNTTLLAISSYFLLKKASGISVSDGVKTVFQPEAAKWLLIGIYVFIGYCIIARIVMFVRDGLKQEDHPSLSSPQQRCLLKCNDEIDKHLKELFKGTFSLKSVSLKHTYEENLQFIHQSMSEHLRNALKSQKLSPQNLFISVFHDPSFSPDIENIDELEYVSHFDPTLHDTDTQTLSLTSVETKGYAGVCAFRNNKKVLYSDTGRGQYVVGNDERRKTIKHYVGIPLHVLKKPVALLNIEFHNRSYFKDPKSLKAFVNDEIRAFVYMYEYQLHKKYFFHHLSDKLR